MRASEAADTRRNIAGGRCACCGGRTEDYEEIAPGIRMCHEWCIAPPYRDHRDEATIAVILTHAAITT